MSKKNFFLVVLFLCLVAFNLQAAIYYVPDNYLKIQDAIDNAQTNDEIIVRSGEYREKILINKDILLSSENPANPLSTTINGTYLGSVVTFENVTNACVLKGFNIIHGETIYGAAIDGKTFSPSIENNIIQYNICQYSIVYQCNGLIKNNILQNNIFSAYYDYHGLLYDCDGTIQNNVIYNNEGTGLLFCDGDVINNTIAYNKLAYQVGGMYKCKGTIKNCISFYNMQSVELFDCSIANYSCIQNYESEGYGNIYINPLLNIPDLTLKPSSPCIDAGGYVPGLNTDIKGNLRPFISIDWEIRGDSSHYDIGAYEYQSVKPSPTPTPTPSPTPTASPTESPTPFPSPSPTPLPPPNPYGIIYVPDHFATIQEAINFAYEGAEIIVRMGQYYENLHVNKSVIIHSEYPNSPDKPYIHGNSTGCVVSYEDFAATGTLSGFNIFGGESTYGAAINGNDRILTIENNIFKYNSGTNSIVYQCNSIIQNNTFTNNTCGSNVDHGVLFDCNNLIQNNTFYDNYGTALNSCKGIIRNNSIAHNYATYEAGGMKNCFGTIQNCIIYDNKPISNPELLNCSIPTYSCIRDGKYGGIGNITDNPMFNSGNLTLRPDSPCIDSGTKGELPYLTYDHDMMQRPVASVDWEQRGDGSHYDIGAYEYQYYVPMYTPTPTPTFTPTPSPTASPSPTPTPSPTPSSTPIPTPFADNLIYHDALDSQGLWFCFSYTGGSAPTYIARQQDGKLICNWTYPLPNPGFFIWVALTNDLTSIYAPIKYVPGSVYILRTKMSSNSDDAVPQIRLRAQAIDNTWTATGLYGRLKDYYPNGGANINPKDFYMIWQPQGSEADAFLMVDIYNTTDITGEIYVDEMSVYRIVYPYESIEQMTINTFNSWASYSSLGYPNNVINHNDYIEFEPLFYTNSWGMAGNGILLNTPVSPNDIYRIKYYLTKKDIGILDYIRFRCHDANNVAYISTFTFIDSMAKANKIPIDQPREYVLYHWAVNDRLTVGTNPYDLFITYDTLYNSYSGRVSSLLHDIIIEKITIPSLNP